VRDTIIRRELNQLISRAMRCRLRLTLTVTLLRSYACAISASLAAGLTSASGIRFDYLLRHFGAPVHISIHRCEH